MSFKDLLGFPKNNLGLSLPNTGEQWIVDKNNLFQISPGFGTTSQYFCRYRRRGDELSVVMSFYAGTIGASAGYVRLPSIFTIDGNKISSPGDFVGWGHGGGQGIGTSSTIAFVTSDNGKPPIQSSNFVAFEQGTTGANSFAASNVTSFLQNSAFFSCYFTVPILQFNEG